MRAEYSNGSMRIEDVSKSFVGRAALSHVSFVGGTGVTGLLGPNGAGKTTLLRIMATVLRPTTGSLRLLGQDPLTREGRLAVRRVLGYMPQETGYYSNFTIYEFVDYMAVLKEITGRQQRRAAVEEALHAVSLLANARQKIRTLSGGMRRRVGLAQALLGNPRLLILDEPTVGLDPEQRLLFRQLVSEIGEDTAIMLSTHQTEDVGALCRRVLVLHHGSIMFDGGTQDLEALGAGRVWASHQRSPEARVAWRTGDGTYRNIGQPPRDAVLLPPTLEDGYLLLVGNEARADQQ